MCDGVRSSGCPNVLCVRVLSITLELKICSNLGQRRVYFRESKNAVYASFSNFSSQKNNSCGTHILNCHHMHILNDKLYKSILYIPFTRKFVISPNVHNAVKCHVEILATFSFWYKFHKFLHCPLKDILV